MTISENVKTIQHLIQQHANLNQVIILAASKTQTPEAIREAFDAGIRHFGENYWQEAKQKLLALQDLTIWWHFIGAIQSNKATEISRYMDWVHTLDREKIIPLLAQGRSAKHPPLNVCIQINLDHEKGKSGVIPSQALKLAQLIKQYPQLKLRGLMTIPLPRQQPEEQFNSLLRLKNLLDQLNSQLDNSLDTLSMGMSNDLIPALQAGSTMVRIGQAIFGARNVEKKL